MLTPPDDMHGFRLANTEFVPSLSAAESTASIFRIHMSAEAISRFPQLRELLLFRNILQLTGEDTGSVALTSLVGAPAKIVAVSTEAAPADTLVEFGRMRGMGTRLSTHVGVALDDSDRLGQIVEEEFGDHALEVVVDDASDRLATGLQAFETLFPRIAPGGSYIIERWSWDHFSVEGWVSGVDPADREEADRVQSRAVQGIRRRKEEILEAIAPMLVEALRTRPDIVSQVTASKHWLIAERGPAELDASSFRLATLGRAER